MKNFGRIPYAWSRHRSICSHFICLHFRVTCSPFDSIYAEAYCRDLDEKLKRHRTKLLPNSLILSENIQSEGSQIYATELRNEDILQLLHSLI